MHRHKEGLAAWSTREITGHDLGTSLFYLSRAVQVRPDSGRIRFARDTPGDQFDDNRVTHFVGGTCGFRRRAGRFRPDGVEAVSLKQP